MLTTSDLENADYYIPTKLTTTEPILDEPALSYTNHVKRLLVETAEDIIRRPILESGEIPKRLFVLQVSDLDRLIPDAKPKTPNFHPLKDPQHAD